MNKTEQRRNKKHINKKAKNPNPIQPSSTKPTEQEQTLTTQQDIDIAVQHHKAGDLPKAEGIYQQILQSNPNQPIAFYLLGLIAHQVGKNKNAFDLISKALAIKPDFAEAHNNLGNVLTELGQLDEAVVSFNEAVSIKPDYAEAHSNLGNALQKLKQFDEAVTSYNKALNIIPDYSEVQSNLGLALQELGQLDAAVESYNKAIAINPDLAEAHYNLGNTLQELGSFDEAVASYHRAIFIKPDYVEAHYNLGNALKELRQLKAAVASYNKALAIKPNYAEVHSNLGNALKDLNQLDDAVISYQNALEIKPSYTETHSNLGTAFQAQGKLNEAVASYYNALTIKPDYAEVHSNLLFCMNNSELYSQKDIYAESCLWEAAHGLSDAALRIEHPHHDCSPERRLRIGYISPDFRKHSVSYFVLSLIASHDRNQFEVFCYSQVPNPDNKTQHLRNLSDCWRSIVGMTMNEIAECIRGDAIDILVDLTGHTANNLLQVFTKRPAPLQVTWLGYPNTTGLLAMNYRLIDAITDPVGPDDNLHSEQLVRLPNGFLCYTPDAEATPIKVPPVLPSGVVTFGSFNNLSKITLSTVSTWARILEATPKSRLLLKNASLADVETRRRYLALFVERGIDIERLEFLSHISSESAHLETYNRIDIGLDTFPYNGTTTTCEALWMGVPVICLRGDRHASRVGASILTRVGQPNLIAETIDDYVAVAGALAKDQARLTTLRQSLRPAMATSPLCDAQGFTRDVETAYKDMWRVWCKSI